MLCFHLLEQGRPTHLQHIGLYAYRRDFLLRLSSLPVSDLEKIERLDPEHEGQTETVRARYVVGCDGARSTVRQALSLPLAGPAPWWNQSCCRPTARQR